MTALCLPAGFSCLLAICYCFLRILSIFLQASNQAYWQASDAERCTSTGTNKASQHGALERLMTTNPCCQANGGHEAKR